MLCEVYVAGQRGLEALATRRTLASTVAVGPLGAAPRGQLVVVAGLQLSAATTRKTTRCWLFVALGLTLNVSVASEVHNLRSRHTVHLSDSGILLVFFAATLSSTISALCACNLFSSLRNSAISAASSFCRSVIFAISSV